MRLLTNEECVSWCEGYGYTVVNGEPVRPEAHRYGVQIPYPDEAYAYVGFAAMIEEFIQPYSTCLVWVTTWGVWPTSENLHLYHVWRRSHGDHRLLFEAPGHWFLDYERADLITLLHLALLFGWDAHIVPSPDYASVFISNDEACTVFVGSEEGREEIARQNEGVRLLTN